MPRFGFADLLAMARESIAFARKHHALLWVTLWLFVVPSVVQALLHPLWEALLAQPNSPPAQHWMLVSLGWLGTLLQELLNAWGFASVYLVAQRQIQNRAGRARTSFKSVAREARAYVVPLFLTSLLWLCFIGYRLIAALALAGLYVGFGPTCSQASDAWPALIRCFYPLLLLVPLAVPAALYAIRTFFFDMIVVIEERRYRDALSRSRELTAGRTGTVARALGGLFLIIYLPPLLIVGSVELLLDGLSRLASIAWLPTYEAAALLRGLHQPMALDVIESVVFGYVVLIFLLANVLLFGRLRGSPSGDVVVFDRGTTAEPRRRKHAAQRSAKKKQPKTETTTVEEIVPPPVA